jgi:hypothetical protein
VPVEDERDVIGPIGVEHRAMERHGRRVDEAPTRPCHLIAMAEGAVNDRLAPAFGKAGMAGNSSMMP